MNKREILQFLGKKKQLLVASDVALEDWLSKEEEYMRIARKESGRASGKIWIPLTIIVNVMVWLANEVLIQLFAPIISICFLCEMYYFFKHKRFWAFGIVSEKEKEAKRVMEEAKEKYQQEISNLAYLAGMDNFSKEFYSTYAISRLESLIREERALTLQEAYTILENQQFQEQTVSHQHKMSSQQDAIVRNTRIAAAVATMTAISGLFNDRR